jgi:hypothetical protein
VRRGFFVGVVLLACGTPQTEKQAAVSYRASYTVEPGVSSAVTFPFPIDGAGAAIEQQLAGQDGGVRVVSTDAGTGLLIENRGGGSFSFTHERLEGLGEGSGVPEATLSQQVVDGGPGDRYVRVNRGLSGLVQIDFEYTVSRDCGGGCGGKRTWAFQGPVGMGLQEVPMNFVEEKR